MKIKKNRFHETKDAKGTGATKGKKEKREKRTKEVDRQEARPISLAELTGAVSSRRTYARTYRHTYVAPQPNMVAVQSTIQLTDLQKALADKRVPNLGIVLNGNTVSVDGLNLVFQPAQNGVQITCSAVGLTQDRVQAAVRKLSSMATTARTLGFIDLNAHLYGTPQVQLLPDGRITVTTVANVRVNPKLQSQAQGVLDQHKGGLVMPEVQQPAPRKAGKRTQLVG